jgi:hypothetical protein
VKAIFGAKRQVKVAPTESTLTGVFKKPPRFTVPSALTVLPGISLFCHSPRIRMKK